MPTPHSITQYISVTICRDAEEATDRGFVYHKNEYTALRISHAVVVQKGTEKGNPTVDLILVDETGKQYMTMVTGNLLKSIPL